MPPSKLSMPIAVPPPGVDPASFYAMFTGRIAATWSPTGGLLVSLDPSPEIARLHAPVKSAMAFRPAGSTVGGVVTQKDTLALSTWPTAYLDLRDALGTAAPTTIHFENVNAAAVREAVLPIFMALGRPESAADEFVSGNGLVKVAAGAAIGAAAPEQGAPPTTPNRVRIRFADGAGASVNPAEFLRKAAPLAGVDPAVHPLLSGLDLDGWIEIAVVDEHGAPIGGTAYTLYLGDGTTRNGTTDAEGRIFEPQIPPGPWGVDLPSHPSFAALG